MSDFFGIFFLEFIFNKKHLKMNVSLEISFNFTFCRFIEEGYGQKMIVYCSSYCVLKSNTDESTFVFCVGASADPKNAVVLWFRSKLRLVSSCLRYSSVIQRIFKCSFFMVDVWRWT